MTQAYQPTDIILILGAVPQEIAVIRDAMDTAQDSSLWGIPFWRGKINGKPVVLAITGIGKAYTAMTLTLFLAEFRPRLVVMTGTGARIAPNLRTGDIIVATTLFEHDYGSLTQADMVYRPFNSPIDGAEVANHFSPPDALLALADQAIATYRCPEVSADGTSYQVMVRTGVVASSDLFGMTGQRIDSLRRQFATDLVEMESAPLARVCETFGLPYLVIRAGSNLAQEAPNDDYLRLGPIAADQAARFTVHLTDYL